MFFLGSGAISFVWLDKLVDRNFGSDSGGVCLPPLRWMGSLKTSRLAEEGSALLDVAVSSVELVMPPEIEAG